MITDEYKWCIRSNIAWERETLALSNGSNGIPTVPLYSHFEISAQMWLGSSLGMLQRQPIRACNLSIINTSKINFLKTYMKIELF